VRLLRRAGLRVERDRTALTVVVDRVTASAR
jgi:hypothetical protein